MANVPLGLVYSGLAHLRALGSVNWRTLLRRLATLRTDYHRLDGRNRYIVNVTYELTYRCNQNCRFCFFQGDVSSTPREELNTTEALTVINSAAALGAGLYLTGGEPLLRKDIVEIVTEAKRRRIKCGINTNGQLLDGDKAAAFARSGLDYLIVSLTSGVACEHDEVVGLEGAFARVRTNIKGFLALSPPTRVFVNFVISPESLSRLPTLLKAAAQLGVDGVTCQHMQYLTDDEVARHKRVWRRRLPKYPANVIHAAPPGSDVSAEEMHRMLNSAHIEAEAVGVRCIMKPPLGLVGLRRWYEGLFPMDAHCLFPWTDMRVAPNGDVPTCQFLPVVVGNVREHPLEELLNAKAYRDFRLALRRAGGMFPGCARCCKLYRASLGPIGKVLLGNRR